MGDSQSGGADDIPSGAVPEQGWRRRPELDRALRSSPYEVITTWGGMERAAAALRREVREDWMTMRPPDWAASVPGLGTVPVWPVPTAGGVRARAVYDMSFTANRPGRPLVRERIADGEEARVGRGVMVSLLLADTAAALLASPTGHVLLIRHVVIVDALRGFFEGLWEKALPFGRPPLPPREGRFLDLLTQRQYMYEIADELGFSRSTAYRYARDIRRRLGARTMAQAGVLAYARGWVG